MPIRSRESSLSLQESGIGSGATDHTDILGVLDQIVNAPSLEPFKDLTGEQFVREAVAGMKAYKLSEYMLQDYIASYAGKKFWDAMTFIRDYPTSLAMRLPEITVPCQLTVGRHDPFAPVSNARGLHKRLPKSKLDVIDCGHFVWEDAWEEYGRLACAFIQGGYAALRRRLQPLMKAVTTLIRSIFQSQLMKMNEDSSTMLPKKHYPSRETSNDYRKELLQVYINDTAKEAAALFANQGTLELPYLADLGVDPRYEGPKDIEGFLTFQHEKMYQGFKSVDVNIYIDTPEQAFGEYIIHQKSGISGKYVHQRFFAHCVAADGKIVLLREALNLLAAADGMFPNAAIGIFVG